MLDLFDLLTDPISIDNCFYLTTDLTFNLAHNLAFNLLCSIIFRSSINCYILLYTVIEGCA